MKKELKKVFAAYAVMALFTVLLMGLEAGCTVCSRNRVFPKVTWYWTRDAQEERAARASEKAYEESRSAGARPPGER